MAPPGKTEPVAVCLDADVVIAGLFSTSGASHTNRLGAPEAGPR